MYQRFVIIFLTIFVVIVSSIILQAQASVIGGTAGVVVTSFFADPNIAKGGEPVTFTLTVRNFGGTIATNIKYEILGLEEFESVKILAEGANSLEREDRERSILGEETIQEWEATTIAKKGNVTYPVTARIFYNYTTESNIVLGIYGRNNDLVKERGITQSIIGQVATTLGPLNVIPIGTIPLIENDEDLYINFDIVNIGGGRTYVDNINEGLDKVEIESQDCGYEESFIIEFKNNMKSVPCKVHIDIDFYGSETKVIQIKLKYSYVTDQTTNVRVLGYENASEENVSEDIPKNDVLQIFKNWIDSFILFLSKLYLI